MGSWCRIYNLMARNAQVLRYRNGAPHSQDTRGMRDHGEGRKCVSLHWLLFLPVLRRKMNTSTGRARKHEPHESDARVYHHKHTYQINEYMSSVGCLSFARCVSDSLCLYFFANGPPIVMSSSCYVDINILALSGLVLRSISIVERATHPHHKIAKNIGLAPLFKLPKSYFRTLPPIDTS